jgi:5-methylcytosine-specific restriction endonuclease McrA
MNYSELLQDPLWIKKRNEILAINKDTCQECGAVENLNVHHCWYMVNRLPWEYPNECFKCLCYSCHLKREAAELTAKRFISGMTYAELKIILQVLLNYTEAKK